MVSGPFFSRSALSAGAFPRIRVCRSRGRFRPSIRRGHGRFHRPGWLLLGRVPGGSDREPEDHRSNRLRTYPGGIEETKI